MRIIHRGFGFVEILIVLVIVLLATWKAAEQFKGKSVAAGFTFEPSIRDDFEKAAGMTVQTLTPGFVRATIPNGTVEWSLDAGPIGGSLIRQSEGKREAVGARISFFRVTGFDDDRHFLPDIPTLKELKGLRSLRFEIGIHAEAENPKLFINDRKVGMDLDGNLANGVAPVTFRSIWVDLPK
jgi:hypothetical protein